MGQSTHHQHHNIKERSILNVRTRLGQLQKRERVCCFRTASSAATRGRSGDCIDAISIAVWSTDQKGNSDRSTKIVANEDTEDDESRKDENLAAHAAIPATRDTQLNNTVREDMCTRNEESGNTNPSLRFSGKNRGTNPKYQRSRETIGQSRVKKRHDDGEDIKPLIRCIILPIQKKTQ